MFGGRRARARAMAARDHPRPSPGSNITCSQANRSTRHPRSDQLVVALTVPDQRGLDARGVRNCPPRRRSSDARSARSTRAKKSSSRITTCGHEAADGLASIKMARNGRLQRSARRLGVSVPRRTRRMRDAGARAPADQLGMPTSRRVARSQRPPAPARRQSSAVQSAHGAQRGSLTETRGTVGQSQWPTTVAAGACGPTVR